MTIKNKIMKVLLINGSPRKQGNTFLALSEVASALEKQRITTEIVSIGTKAVQGCIACNKCGELGRCVFRDELYDTLHGKLAGADGLGRRFADLLRRPERFPGARFWTGSSTRQGSCSASSRQQP